MGDCNPHLFAHGNDVLVSYLNSWKLNNCHWSIVIYLHKEGQIICHWSFKNWDYKSITQDINVIYTSQFVNKIGFSQVDNNSYPSKRLWIFFKGEVGRPPLFEKGGKDVCRLAPKSSTVNKLTLSKWINVSNRLDTFEHWTTESTLFTMGTTIMDWGGQADWLIDCGGHRSGLSSFSSFTMYTFSLRSLGSLVSKASLVQAYPASLVFLASLCILFH